MIHDRNEAIVVSKNKDSKAKGANRSSPNIKKLYEFDRKKLTDLVMMPGDEEIAGMTDQGFQVHIASVIAKVYPNPLLTDDPAEAMRCLSNLMIVTANRYLPDFNMTKQYVSPFKLTAVRSVSMDAVAAFIYGYYHVVNFAASTDDVFEGVIMGLSRNVTTSFKCAQLLVQDPRIKKVFFLVDRSDLDAQTMQEFNKFEEGCVDYTNRTNVLVKQIKDTNTKLICSTIQKMAIAVKSPRYASVMDSWRDEKVIFIIDECHRSQFGKMHNDVKKHFRNAQYFGFTGTPRFKENKSADGRTTADIFGECLHAYMIKNAIFDRNVLGFNVEYITTYKGQYDEDDPTKVEGIDTKEVFESDERVALIVEHILQHHKQKSRIGANKYTALFATSSIPMLVKYYDEFKKHDHNLKIAAIFSYGANEDLDGKDEHSRDSLERIIDDYNKMFDTNFSTDTYQAYNVDVSKRLKVKKIPEIDLLIVVNMYLTGFDSKPLNTLYVDKNLEWHSLLQAFSRTNRVEFETKQFGNIVCYRNLKSATDKALTLFSGGGDIEGVLLKPYAVKWDADPKLLEDERFSQYGVLAPKSNEDLMFVEHMIAHMDDGDSRIACLLPHGILFRGGAEETIRKYIIENLNCLDAVVGLPEKCFHSTGISVCCLVFKKERNGNSDNICFIDASKHYSSEGKTNYLTEEDMDRIVNAYVERKDIDKFCHIASIDEIRENDFNLNIPRYVDTFEAEERVDVACERKTLADLDIKTKADIDKVNAFLAELGL